MNTKFTNIKEMSSDKLIDDQFKNIELSSTKTENCIIYVF